MVVDRAEKGRIFESLEKALDLGDGLAMAAKMEGDKLGADMLMSQNLPVGRPHAIVPARPARFSFNSPHGACGECKGLGHKLTVEPDLVIQTSA